MDSTLDAVKTGTSTIGITFDGGVVVGADHRATMGHFIANKSVKKLFDISDYVALTTAGLVGHAQSLSRTLSAELKLYELKQGKPMTVKGAATLTANILVGRAALCSTADSRRRQLRTKCLQHRLSWRINTRCLLCHWFR